MLTFPQMDYLEKLKTFSFVSVAPSSFGKQPSLTRLIVEVVRARVLVPRKFKGRRECDQKASGQGAVFSDAFDIQHTKETHN